jgi:hypothetical protein
VYGDREAMFDYAGYVVTIENRFSKPAVKNTTKPVQILEGKRFIEAEFMPEFVQFLRGSIGCIGLPHK